MPLPGQSPNIGKKVPTACGDRTRDQSIKSRTLYLTELRRPVLVGPPSRMLPLHTTVRLALVGLGVDSLNAPDTIRVIGLVV